MKKAYPIILTPQESGYYVTVPGAGCNAAGRDIAEAIDATRKTLCRWILSEEAQGRNVDEPQVIPPQCQENDIVAYLDIDVDAYRKVLDMTVERTNITLPRYLKQKAKAAGINFSYELQERLKEKLGVTAVSEDDPHAY